MPTTITITSFCLELARFGVCGNGVRVFVFGWFFFSGGLSLGVEGLALLFIFLVGGDLMTEPAISLKKCSYLKHVDKFHFPEQNKPQHHMKTILCTAQSLFNAILCPFLLPISLGHHSLVYLMFPFLHAEVQSAIFSL